MCAHIIAVAKRNGDLEKFITWYKKQQHQQHGVNVTNLNWQRVAYQRAPLVRKLQKGRVFPRRRVQKISKIIASASEHSWKPRAALNSASPTVSAGPADSPIVTPQSTSFSTPANEFQYDYATAMGSPSYFQAAPSSPSYFQAGPSSISSTQRSATRSVFPSTPLPAAQWHSSR